MAINPYADTSVPVAKSKDQIERLLKRFDVQAIRFTSFPSYAMLEFVRKKDAALIPYRITIKPKISSTYERNPGAALERAERQVWRVAYWWLKTKLEAIEFGLVEFEQDFLPYMLMADSQGHSETVSKLLFERLANQVSLPGDPFGGLRPTLPEGRG